MAYDEQLAARVRAALAARHPEHGPATEQPMFGGLGFLLGGHLAVCASHAGTLLVRVPEADGAALLAGSGGSVEPMTMGGRASRTWLRVSPDALVGDELDSWVARGAAVTAGLPPKPAATR